MHLTEKFYLDTKLPAVREFANPDAVYLDTEGADTSKITKQYLSTIMEIAEWCMFNSINAQPWLDFSSKSFDGLSKDIVFHILSEGKRDLESVCRALKSKPVGSERSKTLMQNFIADGRLTQCIAGFSVGIKNLSMALSNTTLPDLLLGLRYNVVQSLALEHAASDSSIVSGEHIHVVNSLCNLVSEMFGLPSIYDPLARQNFSREFLLGFIDLCEKKCEKLFVERLASCLIEQACAAKTHQAVMNFEFLLNQLGPDPDFLLTNIFEYDEEICQVIIGKELYLIVYFSVLTRFLNNKYIEIPEMIVHAVDNQTTLYFFKNNFCDSLVKQKQADGSVKFVKLDSADCNWSVSAHKIDEYQLLPLAAMNNHFPMVKKFIDLGANIATAYNGFPAVAYAVNNSNWLMAYILYSKISSSDAALNIFLLSDAKITVSRLLEMALDCEEHYVIKMIVNQNQIEYMEENIAVGLLNYAVKNKYTYAIKLLKDNWFAEVPVYYRLDALVAAVKTNHFETIMAVINILPSGKYCYNESIEFEKIVLAFRVLLTNKNYTALEKLLGHSIINQQHSDKLCCGKLLLLSIKNNDLEACKAFLAYKYLDMKNIILNGKIPENTDRRIILALEAYLNNQNHSLGGVLRRRENYNDYVYAVAPVTLSTAEKTRATITEDIIELRANTDNWYVFDSLQEAKVLAYCIACAKSKEPFYSSPVIYKCNNFLRSAAESDFRLISNDMLLSCGVNFNDSFVKQIMLEHGCTNVPQFLKIEHLCLPLEAMYYDRHLKIKKISIQQKDACRLLPF